MTVRTSTEVAGDGLFEGGTVRTRRVVGASILLLVSMAASVAVARSRQAAPPLPAAAAFRGQAGTEPARFVDPGRRQKLATAFSAIDRLARQFVEREHVPGAAWAIVIDGDLAHAGVHGTRQVGTDAPVDADTVFRIASMTKSFTAMAILALRAEGKLSLDDPAERDVPELRSLAYPTADSPRITVRHLLTHAAGFPEDNPWGDQQLSTTEAEFTAMLRRGFPFSNPPGTAFEYSNLGFAILGRIVTRVSGSPYRQFLSARILRPLGMTSTTLEPSEVAPRRFAHGYRWEDASWKEEPALPDGAFGSMGGLLTSLRDLARCVGILLSAWHPSDAPEAGPIPRAAMREMQQLQRAAPGTGGYGYGLRVARTEDGATVVSHGGGLPGFGSLMRWWPEHGVAFIGLGNRTYTGWNDVADGAFALLAGTGGLRPRQPQPSPALSSAKDAVSRLIDRWDADLARRIAAVNLFRDRSEDRRRRELEQLREQLGPCRSDEAFERIENALRGEWLLRCERGRARVAITLAPTLPATVQYLEVRPLTEPR